MRFLLGTRGKTQERVYHSIKEEGERLRALRKRARFADPSSPFHSPAFCPHVFPDVPLPGKFPVGPSDPLRFATCEAASTRCGHFKVRISDKASETRRTGNGGKSFIHTLTWVEGSSQNWWKALSCFLVRCTDFFKPVKLAKTQLLAVLRFRR